LEETAKIECAGSLLDGWKCAARLGLVSQTAFEPTSPVSGLDRFVERVHVVATESYGDPRRIEYLPDGTASLLFRYFGAGKGDLSVRGPYTRALYKTAASIPLSVRVVFAPGGAYPFFGLPVDALQNDIVLLEDLWGDRGRKLLDRALSNAERDPEAVRRDIIAALTARMRTNPFEPAAASVARAAVHLIADRGQTIRQVAATLGISPRHLRRAFTATVGVSPKVYARMARFQRAVELGRHSTDDWSEIAQHAGYFDQSHLNADFHEFARVSPATFRRAPGPGPLQTSP